MLRALLLTLSVSFAVSAQAAERTVSWDDELCTNTVHFDPGKFDESRVKNTVHLLFGPRDFQAPMSMTPFNPQAVAKLDLHRVEEDCKDALEKANRLAFVPLKGIEEYRQSSIAEIKDWCEYEAVKIRGFEDPSALRDYQPAASCSRFIDALEGKTDLQAVFRETLEQNCSRNLLPDHCVEDELANAAKPDGVDWVRLYLANFGWSNCAVRYAIGNVDAKELRDQRAALEKQFRRLFKITRGTCEAPVDGHLEFGSIATIDADIAPGTPASQWNIVNLGLFCGSNKIHPGRIVLYAYGIDAERLQTGQPIAASLDIDDKTTELVLKPYDDLALTPVDADLIRRLLRAHAASVRMKDLKSPNPDRLKLGGIAPDIRSALRRCFKS